MKALPKAYLPCDAPPPQRNSLLFREEKAIFAKKSFEGGATIVIIVTGP